MLCKKPFFKGVVSHGCGQCMPCRVNKRREWTTRIMLEACMHQASSFLTLTYDEENLPYWHYDREQNLGVRSEKPTLRPCDIGRFLKRLRKAVAPKQVRYFSIGEYGDKSQRPHYHLAIFGLGEEYAETFQDCWKLGFTYTGSLTKDSAQYIAGYTTKKLTNKKNEETKEWLDGRSPEKSTMSLKPGLGVRAMDKLLENDWATLDILETLEVPNALKFGAISMPLGRYLTNYLRRVSFGESPVKTSDTVKKRLAEDGLSLRKKESSLQKKKTETKVALLQGVLQEKKEEMSLKRSVTLRQTQFESNKQLWRDFDARQKIYDRPKEKI
jgi:hypothetical protein